MRKILLLLFITITMLLTAQSLEDEFFSDDFDFENIDDLFTEDGDESFIEVVEDQSDEEVETSSELLTTEGVELGGSFTATIGTDVSWSDSIEEYSESFTPSLEAGLYFNARPTEETRFYGRVSTSLPFYQSASVLVESDDGGTYYDLSVTDLKVEELFSDFNWDNRLFFRVGKQNAKWGVGYFFSPADFLSLESIDPEDPEAEREGPIAIKTTLPFGLNNFYTFITVPNSVLESGEGSVSDLILAPMVQMLLGEVELSSGIYYQKDLSPRVMLSGTYGTNTNMGQLSFFGEAVTSYGSDKTFIDDDYTTYSIDDEFFYQFTAGFTWSKEIDESSYSLAAQYLYNGEGYDKESNVVSTLISNDLDGLSGTSLTNATQLLLDFYNGESTLSITDISSRNRHYMGLNFSISELLGSDDLSFSLFSMMNLADLSGFIKPSLTYSFFDGLSTTIGAGFNISDSGDEFSGDDYTLSISFSLGSGEF